MLHEILEYCLSVHVVNFCVSDLFSISQSYLHSTVIQSPFVRFNCIFYRAARLNLTTNQKFFFLKKPSLRTASDVLTDVLRLSGILSLETKGLAIAARL